jgi:broad specificity phosphatase PhoE
MEGYYYEAPEGEKYQDVKKRVMNCFSNKMIGSGTNVIISHGVLTRK